MSNDPSDPTIRDKVRPRVRRALRPLREFIATESAGAVALVVAAIAALAWANSPFSESYETLWETKLSIGVGDEALSLDLRHWVNDGLMTLFFLVVSLEIKRELVHGELRGIRRAALPVVAAIGGMVVPASIYFAFNPTGAAASGWGIPMATDIAFAVGLIALVEPRLPQPAKVFLLSLAIVDDIGAILVIALFYSSALDLGALALAAGGAILIYGLRHLGVRWGPVYGTLGVLVWFATLESGVHATIAGVVIGFLTPVRPAFEDGWERLKAGAQKLLQQPTPQEARAAKARAREVVAPGEWVEHLLHPWTSFAIVPLFALANAGIAVDAGTFGDALGSPVAVGTFLGLVVGKPLGICLATLLAVRAGVASLPENTTVKQMVGLGTLAGIGFTVSLFIAELAFEEATLVSEAKLGILSASLVAAVVGGVLLQRQHDRRGRISG
ncbi:MAG: Na+/H+ antiporter NhaA [Actinomycetota bacterium]|nr:Na+/H+ antiporter NhaA [Actinomycetota bacterium]